MSSVVRNIQSMIQTITAVIMCGGHGQPLVKLSSHDVVLVGFIAIFQHTIGYTWRPVLMVEEEPGEENPEITAYPRKVTGKLSHVPTLAET